MQNDIENKLLDKFKTNFSISPRITYKILPSPHFSIKEVKVLNRDAIAAVPTFASKNEVFDIIMVAPPYGLSLQQKALDVLELYNILLPEGVIIVQRDEKESMCTVSDCFQFSKTRDYGRTLFDFYKKVK